MADADLTSKESNPETGLVLESLPPPPCSLIAASADRLFLAGIPGEPDRVVYSKIRGEGEVVAFNDALTVTVPPAGGDITGLAFLNETLIVFRETAIYAFSGSGFDNLGGGFNFEPRLLSSDCGAVNQESIALAPGGLVFKSSKGWCLLNRGWATEYIGAGVRNYDSETVYAAHVVESQHQVRIVTASRMLVWDYLVNAWMEWSIADGLHACMWNGEHHYLTTSSVKRQVEFASVANIGYGMDVEMLIHLGGLQGFSRVRKLLVLGEYRSAHRIQVRLGKYTEGTYFDDKYWTATPATVGGALQFQHGPSQQQHQAIRVRLTVASMPAVGEVLQDLNEALRLSAISLEIGLKPGTFRHLPAAQRQ